MPTKRTGHCSRKRAEAPRGTRSRRLAREIFLEALMMAVWRRKPRRLISYLPYYDTTTAPSRHVGLNLPGHLICLGDLSLTKRKLRL